MIQTGPQLLCRRILRRQAGTDARAQLVATDSGDVQLEAFFYRVPCVTLGDETEWVELLEAGWNRLAPPTDSESLRATICDALGTEGKLVVPYGNGNAADTIAAQLISALDI